MDLSSDSATTAQLLFASPDNPIPDHARPGMLVMRDGKPQWVYVGMPGHAEDEGRQVDEAVLNRVRMPSAFYQLVRAQLRPGATILVTNSPVGAEPLDTLTIVDAVMPRP